METLSQATRGIMGLNNLTTWWRRCPTTCSQQNTSPRQPTATNHRLIKLVQRITRNPPSLTSLQCLGWSLFSFCANRWIDSKCQIHPQFLCTVLHPPSSYRSKRKRLLPDLTWLWNPFSIHPSFQKITCGQSKDVVMQLQMYEKVAPLITIRVPRLIQE